MQTRLVSILEAVYIPKMTFWRVCGDLAITAPVGPSDQLITLKLFWKHYTETGFADDTLEMDQGGI